MVDVPVDIDLVAADGDADGEPIRHPRRIPQLPAHPSRTPDEHVSIMQNRRDAWPDPGTGVLLFAPGGARRVEARLRPQSAPRVHDAFSRSRCA
ncbi:hypothetical protein GCM10009610_67190 [Pseudonocardia xinjiangensis]